MYNKNTILFSYWRPRHDTIRIWSSTRGAALLLAFAVARAIVLAGICQRIPGDFRSSLIICTTFLALLALLRTRPNLSTGQAEAAGSAA